MFDRAVRDANWVVNKVIALLHHPQQVCFRVYKLLNDVSDVAVYQEDSPDSDR